VETGKQSKMQPHFAMVLLMVMSHHVNAKFEDNGKLSKQGFDIVKRIESLDI